MNLRQRINHELENFHSGVEYHVISPERFTMALDAYTDRILTEVREALLSPEAVEAAEVKYDDTWDDRTEYGDIKASITAALDAVTGEGDR